MEKYSYTKKSLSVLLMVGIVFAFNAIATPLFSSFAAQNVAANTSNKKAVGTDKKTENANKKTVDADEKPVGDVTNSPYEQEWNESYQFAYENGLTKADNVHKANLKAHITRRELAKMMVEFSINVLKRTPDTSKTCTFDDIANETAESQGYILQACQLNIMGIDTKLFNPNLAVTRAEFGTILSRVLYGDTYNGGKPYYSKHLNVLKARGVLKNDSPSLRETRGYVMIMLKRITKDIEKGKWNPTTPTVPTVPTTPTVDTTPRIVYRSGMINQHVDAQGNRQSDPDGTSSSTIDPLTYCKKRYPNTLSTKDYKLETISPWKTITGAVETFTGTKMSTECVQPVVLDTTPRVMYRSGMINQHVDAQGNRQSDPNGVSSGDLLSYCKIRYSTTLSTKDYKLETISTWKTATGAVETYTGTKMSTQCVLP